MQKNALRFLGLTFLLIWTRAYAAASVVPVDLAPGGFRLAPQERKSVLLDGWRHVKKLVIEADGIGGPALFDVLLDGEVKGTIHVPATDPEYTVTIRETARAFEFVHRTGGVVTVRRVVAYVSADVIDIEDGGALTSEGRATAARMANAAIDLCEKLGPFASSDDLETYLLPIKIAAGRAYASALASGDLSRRVRTRLEALLASLRLADPYIDTALADNATFDLAVQLLALRQRLEDLLR